MNRKLSGTTSDEPLNSLSVLAQTSKPNSGQIISELTDIDGRSTYSLPIIYDNVANVISVFRVAVVCIAHCIVSQNKQNETNYDYDSTSIRHPFDCLSKVIEVTVT